MHKGFMFYPPRSSMLENELFVDKRHPATFKRFPPGSSFPEAEWERTMPLWP
jgi:hypothetical protein